jgi:LysR family hydrogen peroxide-inducible transcriptional activator
VLPRATRRLQKLYPKLELYLREDLTAALADRLTAGLIDAALLAFPYEIPGVEVIDVGEDPFWFACNNEHPLARRKSLSKDDLNGCDLLLLEDGHCLREHAIDACELSARSGNASFDGTSLFTLTQMARTGLGATLLPQMAVKEGLAKGAGLTTVPFKKPAPTRRIGVAWRKGSGRREEAQAIAEVVAALAA